MILQNEYIKDKNWTKRKVDYLAKVLGLKPCQVYKWNWDQKMSERKYSLKGTYSYSDS